MVKAVQLKTKYFPAPGGFLATWHKSSPLLKFELEGFVTKNGRLAHAHHHKKVNLTISKMGKFMGTKVSFPNTVYSNYMEHEMKETMQDIDVVIGCTGYKTTFSWLDADVQWNPRTWYKHAFAPKYGERLVFIGWARPHQGGIPATP